jgi:hypothetical protein
MAWPVIAAGNYGTPQAIGIQIPSGFTGFNLRYSSGVTSGATRVVQSQGKQAFIEADGVPYIGLPFSNFDYNDNLTPTAATLSSTGNLTTAARRTTVNGLGGVADDLGSIRLASGIDGYTGLDLWLFRGDADITILHGFSNVLTSSGTNVKLTAASPVAHFIYNGTHWVQDGVPGTQTKTDADNAYAAKAHTHVAGDVVGAASWVAVPATASSPGVMGQMAHDGVGGFLYVCVASNQWRRTALTTWP